MDLAFFSVMISLSMKNDLFISFDPGDNLAYTLVDL